MYSKSQTSLLLKFCRLLLVVCYPHRIVFIQLKMIILKVFQPELM